MAMVPVLAILKISEGIGDHHQMVTRQMAINLTATNLTATNIMALCRMGH